MDKSVSPLHILQVNSMDTGGGADKVAWDLFHSYRNTGYPSWLAVGNKLSGDPDVLEIPNDYWRSRWARVWLIEKTRRKMLAGRSTGLWLLRLFAGIAQPSRQISRFRGREDFNYPGTQHLLDLTLEEPDILHCHNLHGEYFDLRLLPELSRRLPVVLTLHDAWLLSGHCAHSFECERWKTGCGQCPDLTIPPAIYHDSASFNWQRKKEIFSKSRLYVASPSAWLMKKIEQSILAPAIIEARVIPNGVDLSVFHPADKKSVRQFLGIPQDTRVLLFAANGIRKNVWKDYRMMKTAIAQLSESLKGERLLFLALGEEAPKEQIGLTEIRFIPYEKDPSKVAKYYQAADVYIHAARAENFPLTVLEALACGTPVVATAVGGIPEQVTDGLTGFLVAPGDSSGMASRIVQLLNDDILRSSLGQQAADTACHLFDLNRQVEAYLSWYNSIAASIR